MMMSSTLPELRLVGAEILREGTFRHRSVAVARGRITRGPLPAVDLEGCLILPGIVDLSVRVPPEDAALPPDTMLDRAAARAARAGVTTLWLEQGWGWQGGAHDPARAEAVLAAADARRLTRGAGGQVDLRIRLMVDCHAVEDAPRLLAAIRRWGAGASVAFVSGVARLDEMRREAPARFARAAARLGRDTATLSAALDHAVAQRRAVPRFLCRVAEGLDAAGIVHASLADPDGQVREYFSMIGARMALVPAAHAAAAAARAMGDPVVLSAPAVLGEDRRGRAARDLVRLGLCDALAGRRDGAAPVAAAFALADRGLMSLAQAWALVSARPAELMRLTGRGTLDQGARADLVVIDAASRQVRATMAAGRFVWAAPEIATRLDRAGLGGPWPAQAGE